ncbi:MAG: 50S ribosomal protein L4 [Myxococcota bacterium]|jgi:large subunit ribosomal protein L4|nr:50S ribosomal protein L4 [Myxococcota bacterium]
MKAQVYDLDRKEVGEIELNDAVFGVEVREHLFWEVVNWQRAKRRAGTHKVKGRSEVAGGGKKPWRQKGTGRARQGSTRAPHWVGGGVVHGPSPRDYSFKLSKNKRRAALRSALSQKVAEGKLFVVDAFDFDAPRTKRAVAVMGAFEAPKALFVDKTDRPVESDASQKPIHNTNLRLSVRNLPKAKYLAAEGLNVEDILGHDVLFISREAIAQVEEALQ